jgi:hypothetical protein
MKRMMTTVVSLILVVGLIAGVSTAMAAKSPDKGKPLDVIARSNGFPSGPHFNLNVHGKEKIGDPGPGGHSVFVGISGNSTIEYVSNKKSKTTELTVIDPLAECFDGDPARVYLPYKIAGDNGPVNAGGYYVFGRILGSPNKGSDGSSSILVWPAFVVQACNMTAGANETAFGELRDCLYASADLALGLITSSGNMYSAQPTEFVRFPQPEPEKGKGNSKGVEITRLLKWSGFVTDNLSLDTNGPGGEPDGYLNEYDVPGGYDTNGTPGIQEDELLNWLNYLVSIGEAIYYNNEWIFDIADLVIAGQTITNDGTRLFQIRFYPVNTTLFKSDYMP